MSVPWVVGQRPPSDFLLCVYASLQYDSQIPPKGQVIREGEGERDGSGERERERERWNLQSFYNLILVDTFYHFCCIMFTRSEPLSLGLHSSGREGMEHLS